MTVIRPPAVANMFYPADPEALSRQLARMLEESAKRPEANGPVPKAIIAPHAGYVYSGPVAATVYNRLQAGRGRIRRVVLLGPSHRVPVRGIALPAAEAFRTPLGTVPLDRAAQQSILSLPFVAVNEAAHREEHSLEVHLPFLQTVLEDFTLVPMVVGQASAQQIALVLETLWGGPETLIVVSSDLSHYLDYESARRVDANASRAIEALDGDALIHDMACGRYPVQGLLLTARRRAMTVQRLDLRNSGDTAGNRDQVVGYGAWAFLEQAKQDQPPMYDERQDDGREQPDGTDFARETGRLLEEHGEGLLILAARSILHGLTKAKPLPVDPAKAPPSLARDGACFVTLKRFGQLRGCVGSPFAHRPLITDVVVNAFNAAFGDPRFERLSAEELPGLKLSVAVLSPAQPMAVRDRQDLLSQLRPGRDGLILQEGKSRALFLPSVWEQVPEPSRFVSQLLRKANLDPDHWSADMRALRFITESIDSDSLGDPASIWHGGSEA